MSCNKKVKIKKDLDGYFVNANKRFGPGDIIEEMPILLTSTSTASCADAIILSKCVSYKTKDDIDLIAIPVGNFMAYRQDLDANCAITLDTTFNILTIRALDFISRGDELVIESVENEYGHSGVSILSNYGQTKDKEKDMGCGCGKKKKKPVTKILDGTENKKPEVEDNREVFDKFKSMANDDNLKAIKAIRKSS